MDRAIVHVKNYKINQDIVFPFKIGHPLLQAFNEKILKLKEAGILKMLWKKYIYIGDKQCKEEAGDSLGYENVLSPFFILICGTALSIFVTFKGIHWHHIGFERLDAMQQKIGYDFKIRSMF